VTVVQPLEGRREVTMARVLQAGTYLAMVVLIASMGLMLLGLGMAARPESFAGLGLDDPGKSGLVVALVAGAGVIGGAVLGRILGLLLRQSEDENGSY
jgi:hypothetical protein